MSTRVEWSTARGTCVEVVPPGTDVPGYDPTDQPCLMLFGDEGFAIEGSKEELLDLAERIRLAVREYQEPPPRPGMRVTVSMVLTAADEQELDVQLRQMLRQPKDGGFVVDWYANKTLIEEVQDTARLHAGRRARLSPLVKHPDPRVS